MKHIPLTIAVFAVVSVPALADVMVKKYEVTDFDPVQAFERMDLNNDNLVDTMEFKSALYHNPDLRHISFHTMDLNGNDYITAGEARRVNPMALSNADTITTTVYDVENIYKIDGKRVTRAEYMATLDNPNYQDISPTAGEAGTSISNSSSR